MIWMSGVLCAICGSDPLPVLLLWVSYNPLHMLIIRNLPSINFILLRILLRIIKSFRESNQVCHIRIQHTCHHVIHEERWHIVNLRISIPDGHVSCFVRTQSLEIVKSHLYIKSCKPVRNFRHRDPMVVLPLLFRL